MPDQHDDSDLMNFRAILIQTCIRKAMLDVMKDNRELVIQKATAYLAAKGIELEPEELAL